MIKADTTGGSLGYVRGELGTLADLLRPREPRTLAILLRPQTHDLFARSRPGTPKKVMGPPEEGTLADLLAPRRAEVTHLEQFLLRRSREEGSRVTG